MKPRGFTHIVIAVLISVMAIGLVGVAWWYQTHKDDTLTSPVACSKLSTIETCKARADCTPVLQDYCKCNEVAIKEQKCGNPNPNFCLCGEDFASCTTLSCQGVNVGNGTNQNANTNSNGNSNTNSATSGNTNATVDTTGWKTYLNQQLGFTMQYPGGWVTQIVDKNSGTGKADGELVKFWSKPNYQDLLPKETEWTPTNELYYFIVNYNDTGRADLLTDQETKLLSTSAITVDGIQGTKDVFRGVYGDWTTVYLQKNGITYSLMLPDRNNDQKNIADTILLTFKFI
ncbi:MAG: hypothetical protein V1668_04760 [Patescibacteria group bacterium]